MAKPVKPKRPAPPADIHLREPVELVVPAGAIMHRVFNNGFPDPLFYDFGTLGRFNAPDGSYGVLYAAEKPEGAFAETFLRQPGKQQLQRSVLDAKGYCNLSSKRELKLVMLAGKGLVRLGATAEVTSTRPPYGLPQIWSGSLHAHPENFDGIAFYSRHDNDQLCYAIFNRAKASIKQKDIFRNFEDHWLDDMLDYYQIGLLPY